ncbi:serine--tRNA ligase [Acidisoma silvae]|uniref:Serine--tRNA ligase n=1 Tax=Acidisoma silvae TaxID=2802396 RepID=A0A963YPZ5_9PROT|nr:serine--tRNA ligase [Acidisoma silvae]MCB8874641.1 serine--tRNA ligase [Acidisoma silvae]
MHDIRAIRAEPQAFDAAMARRGFAPQSEAILALDAGRRAALSDLQAAQARRNELSRDIGKAKREKLDTAALEQEAVALRGQMEQLQAQADDADLQIKSVLEALPNILDAAVPDGRDESANVVLKTWGQVPAFDFTPRQHFELGEALGLMDFAGAAKLAGARFTVLRGALARLERALGQFMIDLHTLEHGYEEMAVPTLVNDAAVYGTGQLPKFSEDLFRTTDGRWLIPTAEVPLTNMAAAEITPEAKLPWRMTSLTDCFRSEAGSAGRDTRGMLRQHQFRKVEMVSITHPDHSDAEHERMTRCAETVLERLELPHRRLLLCTGDTGFGSARTHDLEVWLPGQQAWREISSCSNMRDFQARRMNARFRAAADNKTLAFAHTLNGSGLAVGRTLIAVMEAYQQADGSIRVPDALRPYLPGLDVIAAG